MRVTLQHQKYFGRSMVLLIFALCCSIGAAEARIVKVLPHFLDAAGRHTLHPSLFERDAYQAHLRARPELCSGLRFDVQWKGSKLTNLELKLEVRGAKIPAREVQTFSRSLKPRGWGSRWAAVAVSADDFARLGSIVAWRISLWDGDKQLAEQKSFLWN